MTNFEKDKERVREIASQESNLAIKDGTLKACKDIGDCLCCDFNDGRTSCAGKALLWLLEDDGEPSPDRKAGQEEAWELAKKIVSIRHDSESVTVALFNTQSITDIFKCNTYNQAAEKVKTWEESKNFKIGGVVKNKEDGCIGVITGLDYDCSLCSVITDKGYSKLWYTYDCTETGRTLPVEDWLRQIGGEE